MSNTISDYFSDDSSQCDSTQNSILSQLSQSGTILEQMRSVQKPTDKMDYKKFSVLHCAKCNLVLGDSLAVCGEVKDLKYIISLKVTKDVKVRTKLELSKGGHFALCTYKVLECCGCRRLVGLVLYSTPQHWASLRNLFLLQKEALKCYMLNTSVFVKASKISFENKPLKQRLDELKQVLEAQLKQMNLLKDKLEDSRIGQRGLPFS